MATATENATAKIIVDKLTAAFKDLIHLEVQVVDESSGKFHVIVCSESFATVPLLDRHRAVNDALAAELESAAIHALTMKTPTPQQFAKQQQQQQ